MEELCKRDWAVNKKNNFSLLLSQVERRVVSQLALAHERQLITKGCTLRLTVSAPPANLTRDARDTRPADAVPTIKLQKVKTGTKDKYVDLDLDKSNDFISWGGDLMGF